MAHYSPRGQICACHRTDSKRTIIPSAFPTTHDPFLALSPETPFLSQASWTILVSVQTPLQNWISACVPCPVPAYLKNRRSLTSTYSSPCLSPCACPLFRYRWSEVPEASREAVQRYDLALPVTVSASPVTDGLPLTGKCGEFCILLPPVLNLPVIRRPALGSSLG